MHEDIPKTGFKYGKIILVQNMAKLFWCRIWQRKEENRTPERIDNMEKQL